MNAAINNVFIEKSCAKVKGYTKKNTIFIGNCTLGKSRDKFDTPQFLR